MDPELLWVAEATGTARVRRKERLQALWGGYGELYRVLLEGAGASTAIVKSVRPPAPGPAADPSRARKCRSYDVELAFYRSFAPRCGEACRLPALLGARASGERWLLLLEDLDAAGFPGRARRLGPAEIDACLAWLAAFHARFLGAEPEGLWPEGTYWHLGTRAEELEALEHGALREAAPVLDRMLGACRFRTIVHGDAKPANFCFSDAARGARRCAAVDFQYAGGGCGMRDVAYFLLGCSDEGKEAVELRWLDAYFAHLRRALACEGRAAVTLDLEAEWRELYPIACADFFRFYAGWAKERWERDEVGRRIVGEVLRTLA